MTSVASYAAGGAGYESDPVAQSTYTYDGDSNLTGLTETSPTATLASYTWTYDADNRVETFTSSADGTAAYSYDADGQLTSANYTYQSSGSYSYDANGNSNSAGDSTGAGNLLLSDGTYTYQYDADGNRTCKTDITTGASIHYTWDYRNRLTGITYEGPHGSVTETILYTYDVFNRLIEKQVEYPPGSGMSNSTQWYVYDGQNQILVLGASGAVVERYLQGPAVDQVLAQEDASTGAVSWLLSDNQGTIRDVVQYNFATGQASVVDHLQYDAYGNITSQSNSAYAPNFAYTGQLWDADAGLYYYRGRWYDPVVFRFLSNDPTGFSAGDANLQRYVFNDPVNEVDPTGEAAAPPGNGQTPDPPAENPGPYEIPTPLGNVTFSTPFDLGAAIAQFGKSAQEAAGNPDQLLKPNPGVLSPSQLGNIVFQALGKGFDFQFTPNDDAKGLFYPLIAAAGGGLVLAEKYPGEINQLLQGLPNFGISIPLGSLSFGFSHSSLGTTLSIGLNVPIPGIGDIFPGAQASVSAQAGQNLGPGGGSDFQFRIIFAR